jgi:hypothetical protein
VKAYLAGRLDRAYNRFLSSLPDNAYVEVTPEGWQLSTDPAEPLTPDEEAALERLTDWLLARITPIRLPDLLIEVRLIRIGNQRAVVGDTRTPSLFILVLVYSVVGGF